ncbi:MAG: class I SAM-dependent methyltransferase [Candidatus Uhrbacteria bacterium]|nr:class I SAM-dependent methyltransferase [Candidatus Uhrbacteria bacterium]
MNPETAKQILQLTQDGYVRIARYFDKTRNTIWQDFSIFRPYVKDGARVLDVGCGNGRLYAALKDKHVTYVGVDQNPYLIEQAQERYPHARFITGDILSLDTIPGIAGEQFDVIFSVAVVCHIPSLELRARVITAMRSLLVRDGLLMMLNWNLWRIAFRHKSIWKNLHQRLTLSPLTWKEMYAVSERDVGFRDVMTWWGSHINGTPLYYRAFTAGELRVLCRGVGFSDISCFYTKCGKKAHWWNGRNLALIARNTLVPVPVKEEKKAALPLSQVSFASMPKIISKPE